MLNNASARAVVGHVIDPVARGLLRLHVSPDAVTVAGTVGASAAGLWFYPRQQWAVGTLVILLFAFSDLLDGTMARMSGRQGPWGAFLDSTLDRVTDGLLFGAVALGFVAAGDRLTAAIAIVCLVGGAVVSYAKARAESVGAECNVGIAERAERLIIAGAAALLYGLGVPYILPAALWLLAALTWFTVGQRMLHVRKQLLVAPVVEDGS
ncbi:MAG: CDP-alcohol phosphatidyltransferase family protein [Candidatus Nanopelagicales bacterium]